jgi:predicted 2-oxoglutarate/Fe(II)-dependent dioxygenase YbiX|tara:strand:- start:657 stop:1241 length:585 start_codon:yes stop_codon:yes gene_type:complete
MSLLDYVRTYKTPVSLSERLDQHYNCLESTSWERHAWFSYNPQEGNSSHSDENTDPLVQDVFESDLSKGLAEHAIQSYINDMTTEYNKECSLISSFTRVRLNRYSEGECMRAHWDAIHSIFDGDHKGVPVLSVVGLHKNAEEGGDFFIRTPLGEEKQFLTEDHTVVVFPSTFMYNHEVTTVKKGCRDSYVAWGF